MSRKRKHAHPLMAMMRADRRLLFRHGIAAVTFLITLISIAVLRFFLPDGLHGQMQTLLLLAMPAILTLFFTGAMLLHEKKQHIHAALYIAAIRPSHYVSAKCIVMTLWGTLMGCLLIWFANPNVFLVEGSTVVWESLLAGDVAELCVGAAALLLSGILFTCLGIIIGSISSGMNQFAFFAIIADAIFFVPAAWDLFSPLPQWASFHPVVWMARAMASPAEILSFVNDAEQWVFALVLLVLHVILFQVASAAAAGMLRRRENA
ncbi:MAG: hypothetical protein GX096_12060 [Clostridiales bacterium]|nr:hypothetical protein [Clostridiales bacterium]